MAAIHESILELIGNTPLVEFKRLKEKLSLKARVVGKLELFNPAGSSKDRAALSMIEGAEREGGLNPDSTIVEFTSGNTGIGLAAVAAAKGYPIQISVLDKVDEYAETVPNSWVVHQFYSKYNSEAHYLTTGPEIWRDTDGEVDIFVAGVGTGGTASGTGRYLKEQNLQVKVAAVQPHPDSVVNLFGIVPFHDPFWEGNIEELTRILNRLGLRVNTFYTQGQGIETVQNASYASLNIIVNPWLFKGPAQRFEKEFGVPSLRYAGLPIGATDTTEFVRSVGQELGLDRDLVEQVVAEEEQYVYDYLASIIGVVSWKRFAVAADANAAVGYTRYLANDFSFTPELVVVTDPMFRPADKERIVKRLTELEYARPPKVVFLTDQHDILEALLGADDLGLIIGSAAEYELKGQVDAQYIQAAFPCKDRLVLNRGYAGYRGSLTFTEDIYDNL